MEGSWVLWLVYYIGAFIGVVFIFYAASRAASVAFFRTKLEYIRLVLKEGRGEGHGK